MGMSLIGQNIRRLRNERSLSQATLAKGAGVSQALIGGLENETIETTKKLPEIAAALGVDPAEIDPKYRAFISARLERVTIGDRRLVHPIIEVADALPVYSAFANKDGTCTRKAQPLGVIPRFESLRYSPDAYAQIVADIRMAPELEPGDTILVNPSLPFLGSTTCVFFQNEELQLCQIGRLEHLTDDAWFVLAWCVDGQQAKFRLDRLSWPICHRIIGKLYRT